MNTETLLRLSAFDDNGRGGNPAGVWVGDTLPDPGTMQDIAVEVGYSETAFIAPISGAVRKVRYYSPEAEVSFCGHATIAAGVALGHRQGPGEIQFDTAVGPVAVRIHVEPGHIEASFRSVTTCHEPAEPALLARALAALRWRESDLTRSIPPARAYARAWHLIL